MASPAPRLSSQDRKDLEKYTKYLVYKCMQVIVQSRLGDKMQTYSAPFSSAADWVGSHFIQFLYIKKMNAILFQIHVVYKYSNKLTGKEF